MTDGTGRSRLARQRRDDRFAPGHGFRGADAHEMRLPARGRTAAGGDAGAGCGVLTGRLPEDRRSVGLSPEDVAVVTDGWRDGRWYHLEPGGLRCFVPG
ncbi:hypothetical protein [Streptomyces sp. NPDC051636]|uniref:hypothetical protein n=1 Tax=Streptomyces sp. NPDC051636 TaxID=3365663 RepID=UPI00378E2A88